MKTSEAQALVSIGLPTFNRVGVLRRAMDSVLAQDYANFELVISDNASTDETQTLCEEFCRRDQRIRYIRQSTNLGAAGNFQAVLDQAQGQFFMWLGDDDWLDRGYLSECARVLASHPEHQLVCGRASYFSDAEFLFAEDPINLEDDAGSERVLSYFRKVTTNGMFYGVMRREVVSGLRFQTMMAGDWLLMANLAYLGKTRTLESVAVNRALGGASQDAESLVSHYALPAFVAKNPYWAIAFIVFRDIAWTSRVYRKLGRAGRAALAARCALAILERYCFPLWRASVLRGWNAVRTRLVLRTRLKRLLRIRN
jgi:glycosyltransferase involved in cell wall biosynthesis